ncbi:MAG: hypothetical protein EOO61_18155, partial [Hymenobacter sp.]
LKIYIANCALMVEADACIANLTPFRGASMDVGTAFEVGYMTALNKRVYGYTNNGNRYFERATDVPGRWPSDAPVDDNGYAIENFGNVDNLMIDRAIVCGTQASIARPMATAPDNDLHTFELAVKWATQRN